jgi:flagellar hook assembly protein FlgD
MTPGVKTGLRGTYPNPFNPTTHIVFSIRKDGPVTMAIYDVSGRRVRTLIEGRVMEAGHHTMTWDGLDDRGKQVSSGVYFCRFAAENVDSATKMILLR